MPFEKTQKQVLDIKEGARSVGAGGHDNDPRARIMKNVTLFDKNGTQCFVENLLICKHALFDAFFSE